MLARMIRLVASVLLVVASSQAQEPKAAAAPQQPQQQPQPQQPQPGAAQEPKPSLVPEGAAGLDALQLARAMTSTMKLSMPGPQHERLAALEGAYVVEMTLTPPGLPTQTSKGEARAMTVLSGRYLLVNMKVRVAGVVMEGLYVLGFDNLRSLYTVSWRDSLSTWSVECAGPESEADKDKVALQGTMVDAASPTGRAFELDMTFRDNGFALAVRDRVKDEISEVMRQSFVRKLPDAEVVEPSQKPGEAARDK